MNSPKGIKWRWGRIKQQLKRHPGKRVARKGHTAADRQVETQGVPGFMTQLSLGCCSQTTRQVGKVSENYRRPHGPAHSKNSCWERG